MDASRPGGASYNGVGNFVFEMENQSGEIFWASGDFPFVGSTANPSNTIHLNILDGAYSVRLGSRASGMPPINFSMLRMMKAPVLKIWFNDGQRGWQTAGENVPLTNLLASLNESGRKPINGAQADAILQELREVRGLLEKNGKPAPPSAPPPPTYADVELLGPGLGRTDAPVVLVEFTDYQCPFCKRFHDTVFPDLVKKYVETGKLRIISRNLPLPFHPNAGPAALAALCANDQEKYWPMREKLFASSADLNSTNINNAAKDALLDLAKFKSCIDAKTFEPGVKKDSDEAGNAGITGTPSFVMGKPQNGKLTHGLIIVGAQPLTSFEVEIKKLLETVK
jgi:protein-disulfide isomerase